MQFNIFLFPFFLPGGPGWGGVGACNLKVTPDDLSSDRLRIHPKITH